MDLKQGQSKPQNRFLKLSLKKNRVKTNYEKKKLNRSSDIMIIDESFDKLISEYQKTLPSKPKIYSPIVINDSLNTTEDDVKTNKEPSKCGNVSTSSIKDLTSPINNTNNRSSIGGWSPGQNILCATPRTKPVPTTPKDEANESLEQCSIKKIQQSPHKLLSDLYGETWKSIPSLLKSLRRNHDNFNGISKRLHFEDDESDKENIRHVLKQNKELYLTGSDLKHKKVFITEKVPSTPEPPKPKPIKFNKDLKTTSTPELPKQKSVKVNRDVKTTTKKRKDMTLTELVRSMQNDVDSLTRKVQSVTVTHKTDDVKRLSFIGSLADNVPSWRCHPEALQYHDNYKTLKEKLARLLYVEFNKVVFDDAMDADMCIIWDTKLRSTAGTTTNRLIKTSNGDRIRTSSIKLSVKVVDTAQRLRDTLIHEMCHAATWLIDGEPRAGHGPVWKKWTTRALRKLPELGEISRCHDMEIHYKYCYKCTKCGDSIKRHSKSIDVTKKCCGYCRGAFEIIVNRKNKDGVVVSRPARKAGPNGFALYVKENYGTLKTGRTHAQIMKMLGEQFSAKKTQHQEVRDCEDEPRRKRPTSWNNPIVDRVMRARIADARVELRCESAAHDRIVIRTPASTLLARPAHGGPTSTRALGRPLGALFAERMANFDRPPAVDRPVEEVLFQSPVQNQVEEIMQVETSVDKTMQEDIQEQGVQDQVMEDISIGVNISPKKRRGQQPPTLDQTAVQTQDAETPFGSLAGIEPATLTQHEKRTHGREGSETPLGSLAGIEPATLTQHERRTEGSETPLGSLDRCKVSLGGSETTTDSKRFMNEQWGVQGTMLKIFRCVVKGVPQITVESLVHMGRVQESRRRIIAARCFTSILKLQHNGFIKVTKDKETNSIKHIELGPRITKGQ